MIYLKSMHGTPRYHIFQIYLKCCIINNLHVEISRTILKSRLRFLAKLAKYIQAFQSIPEIFTKNKLEKFFRMKYFRRLRVKFKKVWDHHINEIEKIK